MRFSSKLQHPTPVTGQTPDETVSEMSDNAQSPALPNQKIDRTPFKIEEMDALEVLRATYQLLAQDRQVDVPADFTHPRAFQIAATGGTLTLEGMTQYGYIYFPPEPAPFSVYLGQGSQFLLGHYPEGSAAWLRIPHVDVVTIVCGEATQAYTFFAYLSTRPFALDNDGAKLNRGGTPEVVTIAAGQAFSTAIDYRDYIAGGYVVPNPFSGLQMRFEVSHDGTTWTDLYDNTGTIITRTIALSAYFEIPSEAASARYIRLDAVSPQASTRSMLVMKKR